MKTTNELDVFSRIAKDIREQEKATKPFSTIFDLVQKINFSSCTTKIDSAFYSTENEFVLVAYPSGWIDDNSRIRRFNIKTENKLVMLNQIELVEKYLQEVLKNGR